VGGLHLNPTTLSGRGRRRRRRNEGRLKAGLPRSRNSCPPGRVSILVAHKVAIASAQMAQQNWCSRASASWKSHSPDHRIILLLFALPPHRRPGSKGARRKPSTAPPDCPTLWRKRPNTSPNETAVPSGPGSAPAGLHLWPGCGIGGSMIGPLLSTMFEVKCRARAGA